MIPIIISAKANSSRVPSKNFKPFYCNNSLVDLTLQTVCSSKVNVTPILTTDSTTYSSELRFDLHKRPSHLALVDTQLLTAQNYLYGQLELPTIDVPEPNQDPNAPTPDATDSTDPDKEQRRPFKRPKKRQPVESSNE